jgi:hypothetical protein
MVGRPRRVTWSGPPSAQVAADVHHEVAGVLAQWGLPEDVCDDAVLVVAALLANVVQHARTDFRLAVELWGRLLCVEVEDSLGGPAPAGPATAVAGHVGGLRLVSRVTTRWGWQENRAGKTVWAVLLV